MFNARDLLGRLLQSDLGQSAPDRVGHAMGPSGLGSGDNPLAGMFSEISKSFGQGTGGLSDITRRAEDLFGSAKGAVRDGNPLAIGGLAALAGAVLGGGGNAARGAVGGGLLALLGSLAFSALSKGRLTADQPAEPPLGLREPQTEDEEKALQHDATLLIRAMINAAKADGEIDTSEKTRILAKLDETGASAEERAYVEAEMLKPLDTASLATAVGGRADLAIQVYAASLLAIDMDTKAEKDYLVQLASQLKLDGASLQQVHDALGVKQLAAAV